MQVMPLLTPTSFMSNTKKRPRATVDDFESHYLKKRLISTITDLTREVFHEPKEDYNTIPIEEDCKLMEINDDILEEKVINNSEYSRIHVIDMNDGTKLPMEQKPGKSKYSIPDFVLGGAKPIVNTNNNKQMILYQPKDVFNSLLAPLEEDTTTTTTTTSDDDDEEFEPMEID